MLATAQNEMKTTAVSESEAGAKHNLKVGVVGLGLGRQFIEALSRNTDVGQIAVCDQDEARIAQARTQYSKIANSYPDLEAMLHGGLDAVCIVTPDHLHRDHVVMAFEKKCHVLVTKPIACTIPEARAMIAAQKKCGKRLMVAHEARFRKIHQSIYKLLREKAIGDIISVRIDSLSDKTQQFTRSPWYASAETGRTAMVGTGIHEVDLLRYLVQKPIVSVAGFSNALGELNFHGNKTATGMFQFEGGTIGEVAVSYEAHFPKTKAPVPVDPASPFILGTKGVIANGYVSNGFEWQKIESTEPQFNGMPSILSCVNAFIHSLVSGEEMPVSGEDALLSLAACVAADISAKEKRFVSPAELIK